jgi:hypothetical protein
MKNTSGQNIFTFTKARTITAKRFQGKIFPLTSPHE